MSSFGGAGSPAPVFATWANKPSAPPEGQTHYISDLKTLRIYNGSSWDFVSDPLGLGHFLNEGSLTEAMVLAKSGFYSFPVEDSKILPSGTTWTINGPNGVIDSAAATGYSLIAYDLGAAKKSKVLIIGTVGIGDTSSIGCFAQDDVLTGTTIDNGYACFFVDTTSTGNNLYKESAGFSLLTSTNLVNARISTGGGNIPIQMAMAYNYDSGAGSSTIKYFLKSTESVWIPIREATDSTFTKMRMAGFFANMNGNKLALLNCPMAIFTD